MLNGIVLNLQGTFVGKDFENNDYLGYVQRYTILLSYTFSYLFQLGTHFRYLLQISFHLHLAS